MRGRFPQLHDRDNLWRPLVVITARKALDQIAHAHSKRQRGGTARGKSRICFGELERDRAVEQIVGAEPSPVFAAQVAEEYQRLLDLLGDESLCQMAVRKMEGFTNDEVAEQLNCSRRTVARKLDRIRIIWSSQVVSGEW